MALASLPSPVPGCLALRLDMTSGKWVCDACKRFNVAQHVALIPQIIRLLTVVERTMQCTQKKKTLITDTGILCLKKHCGMEAGREDAMPSELTLGRVCRADGVTVPVSIELETDGQPMRVYTPNSPPEASFRSVFSVH